MTLPRFIPHLHLRRQPVAWLGESRRSFPMPAKWQRIGSQLLVLGGLLFLLAACGPIDNQATPAPTATSAAAGSSAAEAYPPPAATPITGAYPAPATAAAIPTTNPYPGPDSTPVVLDAPRFAFDATLYAGDTVVSGQSPPDLSLAISDVTFGNVPLGVGVSDADGRFSIQVSPLPEGHRVGITLAELPPGKTFEEAAEELAKYRGEQFMSIPNIGVFFDTALVQPQP